MTDGRQGLELVRILEASSESLQARRRRRAPGTSPHNGDNWIQPLEQTWPPLAVARGRGQWPERPAAIRNRPAANGEN